MKELAHPYPGEQFWYVDSIGHIKEETFWMTPETVDIYFGSLYASTNKIAVESYKEIYTIIRKYRLLSRFSMEKQHNIQTGIIYGTDYYKSSSITGKVVVNTKEEDKLPAVIGNCWFLSDEDRVRALVETKIISAWQRNYTKLLLVHGIYI